MSLFWQVLRGVAVMVAAAALLMVSVAAIEQAQNRDAQIETLIAQRDREDEKSTAAQRRMQVRLDELAEQNAALVELLREAGVDVPASLVTRSPTVRVEGSSDDSDDDDDGGGRDTVVVNPPASSPSASSDNDDEPEQRITDNLPDVPLPDTAGQATNDVKDIADDALDGVPPLIP